MTALTLWVQQPGDAQFPLSHAEGLLQVLLVALSVHLCHVDQSGPANDNRTSSALITHHLRRYLTADINTDFDISLTHRFLNLPAIILHVRLPI